MFPWIIQRRCCNLVKQVLMGSLPMSPFIPFWGFPPLSPSEETSFMNGLQALSLQTKLLQNPDLRKSLSLATFS